MTKTLPNIANPHKGIYREIGQQVLASIEETQTHRQKYFIYIDGQPQPLYEDKINVRIVFCEQENVHVYLLFEENNVIVVYAHIVLERFAQPKDTD